MDIHRTFKKVRLALQIRKASLTFMQRLPYTFARLALLILISGLYYLDIIWLDIKDKDNLT